MITITAAARQQLADILAAQDGTDHCLRLAIAGRGPQGFEYELTLLRLHEKSPTDAVVASDDLTVLIDAASVENLNGATLDYVQQPGGHGFKIDNPNPLWRDPVALRCSASSTPRSTRGGDAWRLRGAARRP